MQQKMKSFFYLLLVVTLLSTSSFSPAVKASPLALTDSVTWGLDQATYAESNFGNVSANGQQNYYIGWDTLNGQYNKGYTRLYFQPQLQSLPAGAQINQALVYIYLYAKSCSNDFNLDVFQVTSGWSGNNLTWNNQPSVNYLYTMSLGCSVGWKGIDITTAMKNWFGGATNNGVAFFASPESAKGAAFRSHTCDDNQCPGHEHPYVHVDYTVPAATYTISGQIIDSTAKPMASVFIGLSNGQNTTTDSSGNYAFNGLGAGGYSLTPSKSGFNFAPPSRSVTLGPNATGQNFTGSQGQTVQISGRVTNGLNTGIDGVLVSAGALSATTDNSGTYVIGNVANGTYPMSIAKGNFTFSNFPATISVNSKNAVVNAAGHYTAVSVDSGFRPDPNGFSFPNKGYSYSNYSAAWVLFKKAFPGTIMENSDGTRKQAANSFFLQSFLSAGEGGHCRGFSHASLVYYDGLKSLETTEGSVLTSPNNAVSNSYGMTYQSDSMDYLQIYQARWYTTKAIQGRFFGKPNDILQLVKDALADFKDNGLDIAIFYKGAGHSVVPYRIEQSGSLYRIYVYENNFPGNTSKYIEVDPAANRWRYNIWGSTFWEGTDIYSIYLDLVRNNFPGTVNFNSPATVDEMAMLNADPSVESVIVEGNVAPLIVDSSQNRLGVVGDTLYNEIPGATINILPGFNPDNPDATGTVVYELPVAGAYKMENYSTDGGIYNLAAYNNGSIAEINNLSVDQGSTDEISLPGGVRQLSINASSSKNNYCYYFADDKLNDASRAFNLCTAIGAGGKATFNVSPSNDQLYFSNTGMVSSYSLTITQTGLQSGSQTLTGNVPNTGAMMVSAMPGAGPGGKNWAIGTHIVFMPSITH